MSGSALRAASSSEGLASRQDFLRGMRQVAGSVAVLTTDGPAGRQAATVSAFCSVSADPPTLLVCLQARGRTATAVESNGVFTLNVLPESGHTLAALFSGRSEEDREARLAGLPALAAGQFGPRVPDATVFACRVLRAEQAHTHRVFIGTVAMVTCGHPLPLIYHDGAYGRLHRAPAAIDA